MEFRLKGLNYEHELIIDQFGLLCNQHANVVGEPNKVVEQGPMCLLAAKIPFFAKRSFKA